MKAFFSGGGGEEEVIARRDDFIRRIYEFGVGIICSRVMEIWRERERERERERYSSGLYIIKAVVC